jgi:hypothetical protein
MKTYEKLARFIELNDDGPQSCLNTTFTQDHKRKILIRTYEALTWKIKHTSLSIQNNQANYMQDMYTQRNITSITKCNACK